MRRGAATAYGVTVGPPEYVGAGASVMYDNDGTLTLARPTVAAGDQMFALIPSYSMTSMTAPSGWTLEATATQGADNRLRVYRKTAGGSESATYNWTFENTGTAFGSGCIVAYRNLAASPVRAVATVGLASSSVVRFPSVTAAAGDVLLGLGAVTDAAAFGSVTPPAGMTERVDRNGDALHYVADLIGTSAGATGDRDGSLSSGTHNTLGVSLALIPA